MRAKLSITALLIVASASAAFATPTAQSAYVERRGLIELDRRCTLFTANVRSALEAGAGQARGALLRGGWTAPQLTELEHAAIGAARNRACDDPRTVQAATQARAGFESWARMSNMDFPGAVRTWNAMRYPDAFGWRLRQNVNTAAVFGVREHQGAQQMSFVVRITANDAAPAAAQIVMRNPARAQANLDVPGRTARGLEAGVSSPVSAQRFWASARRVETIERQRYLTFAFPDAAFQAMTTLDPRETVEIRFGADGQGARYLIEVGDVAAARSFLAIRAN